MMLKVICGIGLVLIFSRLYYFVLHRVRPTPGYFESKHVWLVGASSGIGEQLALALGEVKNIRISLSARRVDKLESLKASIAAINPSAKVLISVLDVRNEKNLNQSYEEVVKRNGDVDILVYNSGINQGGKFTHQLTSTDALDIIQTNLIGAINCILLVHRSMSSRNAGHIVAITSLAGHMGLPQSGVYSATKAGLTRFVDSMRLDTRGSLVAFTDVQPGFVKTPILENATHPTPMLMDSKPAAQLILRAIADQRTTFGFPAPIYWTSVGGSLLPSWLTGLVLPRTGEPPQ